MEKSLKPTITTIIPTIGRPTLARVLGEIIPQLGSLDEIIVVGDGSYPEARRMAEGVHPQVFYDEFGPTKDWGHGPRNFGMLIAKGEYLFHIDDDDRCAPWALETIRRVANECPGKPLMFRLYSPDGEVWPKEKVVKEYNVGTQMFVVPNVSERLGFWGHRLPGDYDFVRTTLDLYPERDAALVWRDEWLILYGDSRRPEQQQALQDWKWTLP